MFKLNLQRFAEEPPIDINVNVDDDNDDDDTAIPPANPELHPITPPNNPMPSGVSGEAWRNVEELLVTLSNNVRVGMGEIREDIKNLIIEMRETGTATQACLDKLGITMDEFKQLLAAATIEQEPAKDNKQDNAPAPKARTSGYLSRRKRG